MQVTLRGLEKRWEFQPVTWGHTTQTAYPERTGTSRPPIYLQSSQSHEHWYQTTTTSSAGVCSSLHSSSTHVKCSGQQHICSGHRRNDNTIITLIITLRRRFEAPYIRCDSIKAFCHLSPTEKSVWGHTCHISFSLKLVHRREN